MLLVTFRLDGGSYRGEGWVSVEYSSTSENQKVTETTEEDLATIFKGAKVDSETLDGADAPIDAAIDDPLSFLDYLILDSNDAIVFDADYVREISDESTSS